MATQSSTSALDSTTQSTLPDAKTLAQASELTVLDEEGVKVTFSKLYSGQQRSLIVFIRHFFCGHCEDYVRELTAKLPPAELSSLSPLTTLTLIGCGEPAAVVDYKQRTGCPFPIYCDPTRALYIKLGMVQSLALGDTRPEYIKSGIIGGSIKSISAMIRSGAGMFKGGDYSQNGGEWLFDESGKVVWCRRMRNTRDHAEVAELKKVLGVKEVEKVDQ